MEEASSGLTIDWRLLLLQAGNFLLLLGVLTWLVWKPLIRSLDERRQAITEGLKAAEAQKHAAEEAARERAKVFAEAREESAKLLADTRSLLKQEREEAHKALAVERERLAKQAAEELAGQKAKLEAEVRGSVAKLVTLALRQVLAAGDDEAKRWEPVLKKVLKED